MAVIVRTECVGLVFPAISAMFDYGQCIMQSMTVFDENGAKMLQLTRQLNKQSRIGVLSTQQKYEIGECFQGQ
jgi:hypothetical protein